MSAWPLCEPFINARKSTFIMKIKSAQVHQQGPLKQSFQLDAKGFNLIFGPNETGKTYLLEAFSSWLFGKGKHSPFKEVGRDWDPAPSGSIELAGLDPDDPVAVEIFGSESKSNLSSRFLENPGLPPDFSKLLVVRAGETLVDSLESLVKDNLSGSGMLEEVLATKNVSKTLQASVVSNGSIEGKNAGEIKEHRGLADSLTKLRVLREEYIRDTGLQLDGLQRELAGLEKEGDGLAKAKRFRAYRLSCEMDDLKKRAASFPQDLDELQDDLRSLVEKEEAGKTKQAQLAELDKELEHREWAENAHSRYRELKAATQAPVVPERKFNPVFLILSIVCLLGAGGLAFLSNPWVAGGAGLAGIVFLALWRLLPGKPDPIPEKIENPELGSIRSDFQQKFGEPLSGEPAFQAKMNQLNQRLGQRNQVNEDLAGLRIVITGLQARTDERMQLHAPEGSKEDWSSQVAEMVKLKEELARSITEKQNEIHRFGVPEEEILTEDPGVAWDSANASAVSSRLEEKREAFRTAQGQQGELKSKIATAIGLMSDDWEVLIGGLEEKITDQSSEYKQVTAEVLGKICVSAAVRNLQKKEDQLISGNLQLSEVTEDLRQLSGNRFSGFDWQDGKLNLINNQSRSDALDFLSTGAKEQVMIALRMMFTRRYLGDVPGFLLLDDAFQHSDWNRRELLVDHTLSLVRERGWQVFYFTMDNHLRDLFKERADNQLGGDFAYHELA
jgi:hypothetical protein